MVLSPGHEGGVIYADLAGPRQALKPRECLLRVLEGREPPDGESAHSLDLLIERENAT
jgi:hypothetical protein